MAQYVRLLSVKNPEARNFYETEALRLGWSVRQLDRQMRKGHSLSCCFSRMPPPVLPNLVLPVTMALAFTQDRFSHLLLRKPVRTADGRTN